jgi:antitoxin MazE
MKTRIVRIGNSQGIRIPKALIEQAALEGDLEVFVENESLVIKPIKKPRAGWDEAFKEMARRGDDAVLDEPAHDPTAFDEEEWQWE